MVNAKLAAVLAAYAAKQKAEQQTTQVATSTAVKKATSTPSQQRFNRRGVTDFMIASSPNRENSVAKQPVTDVQQSTYYDVDSALSDISSKASLYGIKLDIQAIYGKTITNAAQAQRIVDDFVAKANNLIAAKYNSSNNRTPSGGASAARTSPVSTYYDIADQVKAIQSTAKTYDASVAALSQTRFSSQADAQKALDKYAANAQSAIDAKIKAEYSTKTGVYVPPTLTAAQQADYDSWNAEIVSKYGKHLNPAYYLWLKTGVSYQESPRYYLEDAMQETQAQIDRRNAVNAEADAKLAASQKALKESYDAMLIHPGTTSGKNSINNPSNTNSKNYSRGTPSTFSEAGNTKINQISVVRADAVKAVQSVTAAANQAVKPIDSSKATPEKLKELSKVVVNDIKIIKGVDSSVSSANAVKGNNASAKYKNAVIKAEAATGMVKLANGQMIPAVQKNGATNPNSYLNTTIFSSSEAEKIRNAAEYAQKKAGTLPKSVRGVTPATSNTAYDAAVIQEKANQDLARKLKANFKDVIAANGAVIDASQKTSGHWGTGSREIKIVQADKASNITAMSKASAQYENDLQNAKKIAAIPITSRTSDSDKKAILDARSYMLERTPTLARLSAQLQQIQNDSGAIPETSAFNAMGQAFKTVDQLRYEKDIAAGGLGALSVKLNHQFQDALNYNKVANEVSGAVSQVNNKISPLIPTQQKIAQTRKAMLGPHSEDVNNYVRRSETADKVADWLLGKYDYLQRKPVEAGAEVGKIAAEAYVGGAAFKVATGGASLALSRAALAPVLEDAGVLGRLASTGLSKGARHIGQAANVGLLGMTGLSAYDTIKLREIDKDMDLLAGFAVGGIGFSKGVKLGTRVLDNIRAIGGTEVPVEKVVSADVLSGKTRFPETTKGQTASDVQRMFENKGDISGYHASPGPISRTVRSDIARGTDNPGLYIAPQKAGASMYFTRIGAQRGFLDSIVDDSRNVLEVARDVTLKDAAKFVSGHEVPNSIRNLGKELRHLPKKGVQTIIGSAGVDAPSINQIHLENSVRRLSADIRYDVEAAQKAAMNVPKGDAILTYKMERGLKGAPGGAELEATITPGTKLSELNYGKRYMWYENNGSKRLVDLRDFDALQEKPELRKISEFNKGNEAIREFKDRKVPEEYTAGKRGLQSGYYGSAKSSTGLSGIASDYSKITSIERYGLNKIGSSGSSSSRSGSVPKNGYLSENEYRSENSGRRSMKSTPSTRRSQTSSGKSIRVETSPVGNERRKSKQSSPRITQSNSPSRSTPKEINQLVRGVPSISQGIKSVTETQKSTSTGSGGNTNQSGNGGNRGSGNTRPNHQEGENQIAYLYMWRKHESSTDVKKRKKKQKITPKKSKNDVRLKKTIFNKLGSLDTMFGETSIRRENPRHSTRSSRTSASLESRKPSSPDKNVPVRSGSQSGTSNASNSVNDIVKSITSRSKPTTQKSPTSGSSSRGGSDSARSINVENRSLAYIAMIRRHEQMNALRKKKKQRAYGKKPSMDQLKKKRTIFNTLDSLNTMFGDSTSKKTVKR